MIRIPASSLPQRYAAAAVRVVFEQDHVEVVAPELDTKQIDDLCTGLLAARERLVSIPVSRVIRAIDAAARRLLDPAEPERVRVLTSLRAISGFSEPMAAHMLDRAVQDWRAPQLESLVRDELGGPAAIESFVATDTGRRLRAVAPALGLHVFAGNVPGVGVTSIVRALLVRSAVLGKSAAAEPALAPAFARLLADVDADVGECVAVTYWPGGDTSLENAVLARTGLVVHYGGADAIADLRRRAPAHVRFIEHGPRISFAIINAAERDTTEDITAAATDLARAVALFDQQGCVSPQIAYVIGTADQAREVAHATAAALERIQADLPRGRISPAEAAAIRELRTHAEFAAIAGRNTHLWAGQDLAYSVILSDDARFEGTCLNRTLLVKNVPDVASVLHEAAPFGHLLQTVGVAGFHGEDRLRVAAALADTGATRIAPVGEMPWPPPGWLHDGRGPLRELVRWVELEGES